MFSDFDSCYSGTNESGAVIVRPEFAAAIDRALEKLRTRTGHAFDAAAEDSDDDEIADARYRFRWNRDLIHASDAEVDRLMFLERLTEQCRGKDPRYSI